MNLFVRSNVLSRLGFICLNQPVSVLSSLKHQIEPLCAICTHKQSYQLSCPLAQQRYQHTSTSFGLDNLSPWQRMKWNMGFYGKLQVPDMRLALSGYNLYVCCTDFVDLTELIKVLNLPDTFNSWFILLQLHLWMVNVKVSQMGKEGVLLKKYIYKTMWNNVEKRLKTFKNPVYLKGKCLYLQDLQSNDRRTALSNYHSTMIMSIMYYDEGLIGSDKLLANALWVQLFSMDAAVDADKLELMVKYVRKQVHHHDHLEHSAILKPGYISFLPLLDDKLDQKRALQQLDSLHLN